jgi:hypothetical protein
MEVPTFPQVLADATLETIALRPVAASGMSLELVSQAANTNDPSGLALSSPTACPNQLQRPQATTRAWKGEDDAFEQATRFARSVHLIATVVPSNNAPTIR